MYLRAFKVNMDIGRSRLNWDKKLKMNKLLIDIPFGCTSQQVVNDTVPNPVELPERPHPGLSVPWDRLAHHHTGNKHLLHPAWPYVCHSSLSDPRRWSLQLWSCHRLYVEHHQLRLPLSLPLFLLANSCRGELEILYNQKVIKLRR